MPKIKKPQNDDEIIAEGLKLIGEGVGNADTNLVTKGYNIILGSKLEWGYNKPKSRLEKIREIAKPQNEDQNIAVEKIIIPPEEGEEDTGGLNVQKQKRGKRFSPDGNLELEIITDDPDPEIEELNKKIAEKTKKNKRHPQKSVLDYEDPTGTINFRNVNVPPPERE